MLNRLRNQSFQGLSSAMFSEGIKNLKKHIYNLKRHKSWAGEGGLSPLHIAVRHNQLEVCQALLTEGITPDITEPLTHKTPLHIAAYFGHLRITKLLKNFGADLSAKDDLGCSPIHYGAMGLHKKMILFFIENQVSPLLQSNFGGLLDILIRKKNFELVDFFSNICGSTAMGLDESLLFPMRCISDQRWTPFHSAVVSGQDAIFKMLMEKFPHMPAITEAKPTALLHEDPTSVVDLALLQGNTSIKRLLKTKEPTQEYRRRFMRKNWYETGFPSRKPLCSAIRYRDIEKINEVINSQGIDVIFDRKEKTGTENAFQALENPNALDFAAWVYSLPFFDLIIERKVKIPLSGFLILERSRDFFLNWAIMEAHPLGEAFLKNIVKESYYEPDYT